MHLNHNDQNRIMGNFPSIKLSYVKNIHKKVSSANIFLAIPKGTKYFVWFQHFKNRYICLYMEIDRRGHNIKSITVKNCCFSKKLCNGLGTILYGTLFNHNNHPFFTVEDIFISEYIEGSCNTKAIELYNPTATAVTMDGTHLQWHGGVGDDSEDFFGHQKDDDDSYILHLN